MVGTPIGNLEDITLRALRVLREVSLIAAEDTRTAQRLLAHYGISTPTTSYFEHNELAKLDQILAALQDADVALISEAGMPGLSDPGYRLIQAAVATGVPVVPVPGPCALVTALVISGLPTDSFVYLGFLPRKTSARRKLLEEWREERRTLVAYEAPHRLAETLQDMLHLWGDRPAAVARELTKTFEEVRRGSLTELIAHWIAETPRGEITLVIGGQSEEQRPAWSETQVQEALTNLLARGMSKPDAARAVADEARWSRRDVYQVAAKLSGTRGKRRGGETNARS